MSQKRALVKQLAAEYPLQKVCAVLELPRSTYYYQAQPAPDEAELKACIQAVVGRWPTYGYPRVTVQLRREYQLVVSSKRVRRLLHELGIAGEQPRKKGSKLPSYFRMPPKYMNRGKMMPLEDNLQDIHGLDTKLRQLEQTYSLLSEDMYTLYRLGELEQSRDLIRWVGYYELRQERQRAYAVALRERLLMWHNRAGQPIPLPPGLNPAVT